MIGLTSSQHHQMSRSPSLQSLVASPSPSPSPPPSRRKSTSLTSHQTPTLSENECPEKRVGCQTARPRHSPTPAASLMTEERLTTTPSLRVSQTLPWLPWRLANLFFLAGGRAGGARHTGLHDTDPESRFRARQQSNEQRERSISQPRADTATRDSSHQPQFYSDSEGDESQVRVALSCPVFSIYTVVSLTRVQTDQDTERPQCTVSPLQRTVTSPR